MKILPNNIAVIENDSHYAKWIEESGRLDIARDLIGEFADRIPPGGVVADVGACLGDHTITYSQLVGLEGTVHAFECNPEAFQCLAHNTVGNRNVQLHPYGLGAAPGFCNFATSNNVGASHLTEEDSGIKVEVKRLDDVAADWPRLDFLKIDAEGFEPFVLIGGRKTIERLLPVMFIEVNDGALKRFKGSGPALVALIDRMGYDVAPFPADAKITDPQYDLLCVPRMPVQMLPGQ